MVERVIVIGGSAGAHDPLREIVARLSPTLPAPVLVTLHLAAGMHSKLPQILESAGPLEAKHARHGEPLTPGRILVAPPDRHLVVHDGVVHLSRGPRENRHRPAVDPLFNTAARWYGPGVIAVVLSGGLDDGSAGAAAIAAQDGTVLVQDPAEARISAMPGAVIAGVRRARVARARDIGVLLNELVVQPDESSSRREVDPLTRWETQNVDPTEDQPRAADVGSPTAISCPDCGGGMYEALTTGTAPHYLCHVGHSWSPETLMEAQRQASEASLYGAAAKLLEEATVLRRLAELQGSDQPEEGEGLQARAEQAERQARAIQDMVLGD